MSNYTKSTNFTAKDSLPTGDTNKVIRGSEFDTEFDAIQTAVGTKSDLAGPTFTGTATFANLTATGTVNFTGGSVTTNIDGGTIDGVTIGGSTPGAGTFSSLTATTADINAGTVDNTVIGGATPAAGTFSSLTATTANIDGGNIDGTVIGASSTAAISGTTGTFSGAVTGSNLNVSNWDTAYGWGDHGVEGYLTSVTFSDIDAGAVTLSSETFVDSDTQIPTNAAVIDYVAATIPLITEVNDLTVSVTWANVPDANITQSSVTQHQAALSINTSQISGGLSLTDITDVTATASEVNTLDGITATTAELNYTDGVTSNIQTQLDSKVGASYTGDVDITGELLVDSYNETFKKVSSVTTTSYYDIANATYASKSLSVSQDSTPSDILFNGDGTKAYMLGYNTDAIYQYSLSTAYDISSGSYDSVSFSVSSQDSVPLAMVWNADGTKLYVAGSTNDSIFQYTLSTAYNLATASYSSVSLSVSAQTTNPDGLFFKPDGTIMYLCSQNGAVYQYTLSTAFDLSTASYASKSLDVSGNTGSARGVVLSSDGLKVFIVDNTNTSIDQYNLSTAWDISTGSYANKTFSVTTQENFPMGVMFSPTGDKMYVVGTQNDTIYQYTTSFSSASTTFDCENANVFETELDANTTVVFSNPPASGTPVVSYYQIGSASYTQNFSVASQETEPQAIRFNSNGTKMFILGDTGDDVNEYNLSTAFDISTASYSQNFSVASEETTPKGLAFNNDGTKMFVVGFVGDDVNEYNLSTGFDVSTASYSQNFSVSTNAANPSEITFNSDGTKMFVVSAANRDVNEYALTTGFDVSTASYSQNFSVNSQDTAPEGIAFNSNGTKMFVVGRTNDKVYEYTLTTGFDLSTASYSSTEFSVATQEITPYGIAFNSDGSKMFIVGADGDDVNEYSTSSSTLNDSTAYAMSLKVVQDSGASGYTVTWPTSVDWPSATAPTLTATASAVDQFVFYTYDGGTTWYGFTAGQALG